jgi:crotonobetainyl-CoA:carnitine CoA-transferase CaiB-like acyl-CoA transferase
LADPRFASIPTRRANLADLTEVLDGVLSSQSTAAWIAILGGHVPVAPIYDIGQALDSEHVQAIAMTDVVDHPDAKDGRLRMLASPIKVNGKRPAGKRAPKMGERL